MPFYDVHDQGEAFDRHVSGFFLGHDMTKTRWPIGPMDARIPGFFVYEVAPGPRFSGWSYLTAGCWRATARDGHGLEFVLSVNEQGERHVEILTMLSYYHAGPASQRHDVGHTSPIGEPWTRGSSCDFIHISLPYAYGPDLELCRWQQGHIRVLAVLPITAAERDLKISHGVEALESRLEETGTDFANPLRRSVI